MGNDQARIQFDRNLEQGADITGILEYQFAEKDQSWGIFTGALVDKALTISYQYSSEGVVSQREITFTNRGTNVIEGEGFTFKASQSCAFTKSPYPWKPLKVSAIKADTFHDPETGYYARLKFEFPTAKKDMKIRCIGTVSDADGASIARWINIGFLGTGNINHWNMATNIRPEQVDLISSGDVTCQYS